MVVAYQETQIAEEATSAPDLFKKQVLNLRWAKPASVAGPPGLSQPVPAKPRMKAAQPKL